jgi:hypothetical protein
MILNAVGIMASRPRVTPPVPDKGVTFDTYADDAQFRERIGFRKDDIIRLKNAILWPDQVLIGDDRPGKEFFVSGEMALLLLLRKHHRNVVFTELESEFGYRHSTLSKIFAGAERLLLELHGQRLTDHMPFFVDRFAMYNDALHRHFIRKNDICPPEAVNCCGFLDRTSVRTGRPRDWNVQEALYSMHSEFHCVAYQGFTGMDGMIIHFFGGEPGCRNDKRLLAQSGLNNLLQQLQQGQETQYWAYCDKCYVDLSHVRSAHTIQALNIFEALFNNIMGVVRVTVEWTFSKLKSVPKLVGRGDSMMHLQQSNVDAHIKCAALITNMHTCLYGSNASMYFGVLPPTLEEYFF